MSNLSLLSSNKLPEFIREEYPALVGFVEAYYRYVETLENIQDLTDIDVAPTKYVSLYKETVARGFGDPKFLETRRFIQSNKEFFSRKGSPEAFKFFFKAYFGEEIEIELPNYLVASGGIINTSYFCYVTTEFGTLDTTDFLEIHGDGHDWRLEIGLSVELNSIVKLSNNVHAIYFHMPRGFKAEIGSRVIAKDINRADKFIGRITGSPYRIEVAAAGRYWQRGQIITFPPSDPSGTPTIARVRSISANSGINSVEIVQHGFPHTANQTVTLSQFPFRPVSDIVYTETITQFDPRIVLHTLDIADRTAGFEETIDGQRAPDPSGYFLENYGDFDYNGVNVISQSSSITVPPTELRLDYTDAMWEESRSTLTMILGPVSQTIPVYTSENSLLSSQHTKLHDNFFYQAYAYLIKTQQNIGDYRGSIDLIHPAGLKFFAELIKLFDSDAAAAFALSRAMSVDKIFLYETVVVSELDTKDITKPIVDINTVGLADFSVFGMEKPIADVATSSESSTNIVGKNTEDSVGTNDGTHSAPVYIGYAEDYAAEDYWVNIYSAQNPLFYMAKALSDAVVPTEIAAFELIRPYLDDAIVLTDFSALVATVPVADTATAADGTPQATVDGGYDAEIYDSEAYSAGVFTINIV